MLQMSFDQYGQFLEDNIISDDEGNTAAVKRVGKNIQKAVEQYFIDKLLILISNRIQSVRNGKNNMEISNFKQIILSCVDPSFLF